TCFLCFRVVAVRILRGINEIRLNPDFLGKELWAFLRGILQFDFRSRSQYLLGMRRLQEKWSPCFLFQRKSVMSGALEMQPVSTRMAVYGEMEVSRLLPAETAVFMFKNYDWGGLELWIIL
uniref:Uncharacterized protein n=1 Tax=Melopsittacus undulatus TaxID=13146 RepID=A0A8V5FYW9_MELUD